MRVWEARKVGAQENDGGSWCHCGNWWRELWIMQGESGVALNSYFGFHFKFIWVNEGFGYVNVWEERRWQEKMTEDRERRMGERMWIMWWYGILISIFSIDKIKII